MQTTIFPYSVRSMADEIFQLFPFLAGASEEVKELFLNSARIRKFDKDQILYMEGDSCDYLAMVLSGSVRVYKVAETGREITLYRVTSGECCFLTASCVMRDNNFPAIAIVEEELHAILIPSATVLQWVKYYDVWRDYIFSLMSNRLSDVASILNEIKFRRVDDRLAEYLLKQNTPDGAIKKTHQDIALELGTAREVVSRILKNFEKRGIVRLTRGTIRLLDLDKLAQFPEPKEVAIDHA